MSTPNGQQPNPQPNNLPEGYEIRQKRPWYKKPGCIIPLIIVIIILLFMGGCTALFGKAANDVNEEMNTERAITYEVDGDATGALVTFINTDGNMSQENGVALPWSKDVTFTGFDLAQVSVTNGVEDEGTINCRILYNGEVVTENSASGMGASASCSIATSDIDTGE
ncbi:hypothetical protein C3B44_07695 [Corynebacterium yudongzhengii]|uniref:MmpS family membrane protein n=1 Tax=Corynebacterium yudongzhengii TaxID=2080740 RepID=A0A2U1T6Q7_9CORY|nr:MmpS family transport accessory protein [Corynebacterium yudongzhengii]AWB82251.1 hypothetical protein C3B44_07695 [Corynebacterium yudongzhengii]PWC01700.1 hypothetical protein DF222_06215 [Corynebacterium yudongzhengii]